MASRVRSRLFVRIGAPATVLGLMVLAGLAGTSTASPALAAGHNSKVFLPQSQPFGKGYGEWAAEWHKWLHGIPAASNPFFHTTGQNCTEGQSGHVWFLMGIPAERNEDNEITGPGSAACTVPVGKGIFVPVQNSFWWNWTTDPPGPHSSEFEAYVRSLLAPGLADNGLAASVDGEEVTNLTSYGHESPVFYSLVPDDNLIDATAGGDSDWQAGDLSGPHYDAGVYLMVKPLSPGEHEISTSGWNGAWAGTWHITVVP